MKALWKTLTLSAILISITLILALSTYNIAYAQENKNAVNETMTSLFNNFLDGIKTSIDKFLTSIQSAFIYLIHRGLEVLITIARASYIALGLLGLVLWATGISPYRGRHLIVGSIILAIVSEVAYGLIG
ncbi:MAG: hypothetical protein ACXQTI_08965 [Candidatus Nezhaarchaeales archaeon]